MKQRIEKPKVFISYAWGTDLYQEKVLSFAAQLMGDGICVVIDKWDLTEGNDTYAFMEKCANDSSITNVLILLDPIYAQKADDHSGGVGTETQIISAKVYKEVNQDKFIPIIMERDENGNVCKPTYLQGRLHFDLTIPEDYDNTYQRLVKTLYGEETYAKPKLGEKPKWVSKPITVNAKSIISYDSLKNLPNSKSRKQAFEKYLAEIKDSFLIFARENRKEKIGVENYLEFYEKTTTIKDNFLQLIASSIYLDDAYISISAFFESTKNELDSDSTICNQIVEIRLHEFFIYVIAFYLKTNDFTAIAYILSKTYFDTHNYSSDSYATSYLMLYSGAKHQSLDKAVNLRDNKKYCTGTGQYWIETISTDFCSKNEFVLADLICFNYSIYGGQYLGEWSWFPITYIYDDSYNSLFKFFAKRLISEDFTKNAVKIFGFNTIEEFKNRLKEIEDKPYNTFRDYRYLSAFDSASLIKNFIKSEQVATLK